MKEPDKIPLTDNPRNKEPQKIQLSSTENYDIDMLDDIWIKDENHKQNTEASIQKLEADKTN